MSRNRNSKRSYTGETPAGHPYRACKLSKNFSDKDREQLELTLDAVMKTMTEKKYDQLVKLTPDELANMVLDLDIDAKRFNARAQALQMQVDALNKQYNAWQKKAGKVKEAALAIVYNQGIKYEKDSPERAIVRLIFNRMKEAL